MLPPSNTIPGARVLLRELTAAEVASLLDEQAMQDGWAPGYPFEGSMAAARGFQVRSAEQHRPGFGMYQIVRIADGLVIGDIGFYAPPEEGSVEVGFGSHPRRVAPATDPKPCACCSAGRRSGRDRRPGGPAGRLRGRGRHADRPAAGTRDDPADRLRRHHHPVVLGSDSEVLDVGRARRLFTPGLLRAMWLRDRGCTIPGCGAPPLWADAHHIIHWVDGGPTSLTNGALLCGRHHTIAHQRGWTATATTSEVTWHL